MHPENTRASEWLFVKTDQASKASETEKTKGNQQLRQSGESAVVLKVWFQVLQQQHHLGACEMQILETLYLNL